MKVVIIEDEEAPLAELRALCARAKDLHLVGEARSGVAGIRAVKALRPDLLLLDVELPDMSGFEVLRALRERDQRRTILVTTSEQDGATAFAAGAAECLLKPVDAEAFSAALARAGGRLRSRLAPLRGTMRAVAPTLISDSRPPDRPLFLVGEREHQLYPLEPDHIDFIESAGNYVNYHVGRISYMARESIKRLDDILTPVGFVRIERSILLNIRAIAYAQSIGHGGFAFTLASGSRLHSSHAYRDTILAALPLRRRAPRGLQQPSKGEALPGVGTPPKHNGAKEPPG
jgi:two-component system, LytTR family, response regulator